MDKQTALLHAARGAQGDLNSLLSALRAALLGDGMATYAGNPNGNVTPANVGEVLFDTTNVAFWKAGTTANTGWQVLSVTGVSLDDLQSLDISGVVEFYDDFMGDAINGNWDTKLGTDGACAVAINVAVNGTIRITGGAVATVNLAQNGAQFQGALNFKPSTGGLIIEGRISPITTVSNASFFFGITDQTAALEMPITLGTGTALSTVTADDAVGFMFTDLATTSAKDWYMGGVKATAKTSVTAVGTPPRGGTYQTLRIEVSSAGTAAFYVDGTLKATITNAITAATPVTPVIVVNSLSAVSKTLDVDYLKIRALRG